MLITPRSSARIKTAMVNYLKPLCPSVWDKAQTLYRRHHFEKAGIVFCHIPKNAGSSIAYSLYGRRLGHVPLSQLLQENIRKLPMFAIYRDPVARFFSACNYAKGGGGTDGLMNNAVFFQGMQVEDFLAYLDGTDDAERDPVFRSQSYYLNVPPRDLSDSEFLLCPLERLDELGTLLWFRRSNLASPSRMNASKQCLEKKSSAYEDRLKRIYHEDFRILGAYAEHTIDRHGIGAGPE